MHLVGNNNTHLTVFTNYVKHITMFICKLLFSSSSHEPYLLKGTYLFNYVFSDLLIVYFFPEQIAKIILRYRSINIDFVNHLTDITVISQRPTKISLPEIGTGHEIIKSKFELKFIGKLVKIAEEMICSVVLKQP